MKIMDPRTWLWSGGRHLVDAGRVGCPLRGDVDVEACFACGRLLRFEEGTYPVVVCDHPIGEPTLSLLDRAGW